MKFALAIVAALLVTVPVGSASAAVPATPQHPFTAATQANPFTNSYALSMQFKPDVSDWIERSEIQDCTGDDDGAIVCILGGSWSDQDAPLTGSVTDSVTGVSGQLSASCNISGDSHVAFSIAPPAKGSLLPVVDLVDAGGEVRVNCAWRARLADQQKSVLVGRASASGPLAAIDAGVALVGLTSDLDVSVVGGSGVFAGVVGDAKMRAGISWGMLGESGELPIDFELVSMGSRGVRSAAAPSAAGGAMDLTLWSGRPGLKISAPTRLNRFSVRSAVLGVTAPGAKCSIAAKKPGLRLKFSNVTADANGIVRIPRSKKNVIGIGRWRLSMSCTAGGGRASTAARFTVTG
ncbi:MAG: hypothetical protein WAP35_07510 [Solirubrobacterales bacterium]